MSEKERQGLVRLIYVLSIIVFALIIILGFISIQTTNEITKLKSSVTRLENVPKIIPKDGKDSVSVHTVEKIIKQVPIPGKDGKDGKNGVAGENAYQLALKYGFVGTELDFLNSLKGKDAPPARLQETWIDPETCVLMTRYQGDDSWTLQAYIPNCEAL